MRTLHSLRKQMEPFGKSREVEMMSGEELVRLYQLTGYSIYMGALFQRYKGHLYGLAFKYLQDEEDAKDVLCSLFLNLMEKWRECAEEVKNLNGYLAKAIRNESLALLRERKKVAERLLPCVLEERKSAEFVDCVGSFSTNSVHPFEGDLQLVLHKRLWELEDSQRICIELFFFEGKTYKEIALETGYSLKQVKSYLQNGKRNLRKKLQEDLREKQTRELRQCELRV